MFGIRPEPIARTSAIDTSARGISARSRRTARDEERAFWTAQDQQERAEQHGSARAGPVHARPALKLIPRI